MKEKRPHPAKFSEPILNAIAELLEEERPGKKLRIIDPFAGVGGVHYLQNFGHTTIGIEIEKEWASQHPSTLCGNVFDVDRPGKKFKALITSVCYGNRFADHHNPKDGSKRHGYKFDLGRDPSKGSSAVMQWGKEYRKFHRRWLKDLLKRWVEPKALIVINISNHYRDKKEMHVAEWFVRTLIKLDCRMLQVVPVQTRRMREGKNHESRVDREFVLVFEAP